jgi:accessory gene regulator protein AgrB
MYEYTVMSFELTRALTYFMDLMDKDFMEYLDKFIIVFIDDVWVYSKDEKEHEELQHHKFYAKLSKCEFWLKQVAFLSRIISKEGITVDLSQIRDVLS